MLAMPTHACQVPDSIHLIKPSTWQTHSKKVQNWSSLTEWCHAQPYSHCVASSPYRYCTQAHSHYHDAVHASLLAVCIWSLSLP